MNTNTTNTTQRGIFAVARDIAIGRHMGGSEFVHHFTDAEIFYIREQIDAGFGVRPAVLALALSVAEHEFQVLLGRA